MGQKGIKKWLRFVIICMILSATIYGNEQVVSAKEMRYHTDAEHGLEAGASTKASKSERFTENGINYLVNEDGSLSDEMQHLRYTYDVKTDSYTVTAEWTDGKNIVIADTIKGKKVTTVGSMNFLGFETIKLGKNINKIEENAFSYCESLKTVMLSESVTTIGKEAFANSGLEYIVITKNVKSIGEGAFSNCKNLKKVEFKSENLTTIPQKCFAYTSALKEIILPAKVTKLEDAAFSNCTGLEKVVINGKVKTIPTECFYMAKSLKNISLPETVTKINESAFSYSGLEKMTIPSNVTTIGKYAFGYCESLKTIHLSKALTKIGNEAFSYSGLEELTIPSKVTSIGDYAAYGCKKLKTVTIKASLKELKSSVFANSAVLKQLNIAGTIKTIKGYAFNNCIGLEELNISGTVNTIESGSFSGCSSLKSVNITGTVKIIKNFAFQNCKKLSQFICSKKVKKIEENAFYGCESYLVVKAPKNSDVYRQFYEGNKVLVTDSEDIEFSLNTGLMIVGESKQISAYNYPGTLKWKSSNSSVIKISSTGKATAKKAGNVTLTATCGKQKFTLKMQVLSRTKENVMRVIYAEYVRPEMSDYEKVIETNKWLVQNVKYDYDNYLNNTIPWTSYTADGAFVNGLAVCNGYALAFKEIMDHYEIPCRKVDSMQMNHAWNAVQIKGHWYHVDSTWNDPIVNDSNGNSNVYTDYLLVSDSEFKGHYGYNFHCTTSKRSKVNRTHRTESAAAKKTVTEKAAVNPYLNAVSTSLVVKGESFKLKLTGTKAVKFTSSNKKVATVTSKGVIKAKKAGTAVIKVKGSNGKTYSCKVTVENPKLNKTKLSLSEGESYSLKVKSTKQTIVWKTSNSKVATVTAKGKVMAVGAGKAKITAEVNGKKMTCTLTVHAHAYKETVTKNATCTTDGTKQYKCSCGKSYTEKIEALGHNYQWEITKEASKTEAQSDADFGTRVLKCENCKDEKQTQSIIHMGDRMVYGYFDEVGAEAYLNRVNKFRREEVDEWNHETNDYSIVSLPEMKTDVTLISEAKLEVIKTIAGKTNSDAFDERGDAHTTYKNSDVEYAWNNFYRTGLLRAKERTLIGTCCFYYDSNGDGEMNEIYWGMLVEDISDVNE